MGERASARWVNGTFSRFWELLTYLNENVEFIGTDSVLYSASRL